MEIKVSKQYLKNLLFFGILNLIIGIGNISLHSDRIIIMIIWLFAGFVSLTNYFFYKSNDYININEKNLFVNNLLKRQTINLSLIEGFQVYKNKIELKRFDLKKIIIYTWLIDLESKNHLADLISNSIKNKTD
jgi:hypothetical protein